MQQLVKIDKMGLLMSCLGRLYSEMTEPLLEGLQVRSLEMVVQWWDLFMNRPGLFLAHYMNNFPAQLMQITTTPTS
jgi:hypothetical protein